MSKWKTTVTYIETEMNKFICRVECGACFFKLKLVGFKHFTLIETNTVWGWGQVLSFSIISELLFHSGTFKTFKCHCGSAHIAYGQTLPLQHLQGPKTQIKCHDTVWADLKSKEVQHQCTMVKSSDSQSSGSVFSLKKVILWQCLISQFWNELN